LLALTGTETVLLVDDDEIVRATVVSMLEGLGYEVLTAASALEAISILQDNAAIALLFTDVVMPGPTQRPQACRTGGGNQSSDQGAVYLGLHGKFNCSQQPARPRRGVSKQALRS
jgi:Response regulator receiver domain